MKLYCNPVKLFIVLIFFTSCSFVGNVTSVNQNIKNIEPCECEDSPNEKICRKRYKPVCGCDGITYDNACFARKKGVKEWSKGACK